jgi:hypothetical protein
LRADVNTSPTLDTFGEASCFGILWNRSHGTGLLAFQTFIARFAYPPLEKTQRRNKTEKGSQGAEIAAPESGSNEVEGDDSSEDEECDGGHIKDRLKKVRMSKGYPSEGSGERTQKVEKEVGQGDHQGIDEEGVKTGQESKGVHEKSER